MSEAATVLQGYVLRRPDAPDRTFPSLDRVVQYMVRDLPKGPVKVYDPDGKLCLTRGEYPAN